MLDSKDFERDSCLELLKSMAFGANCNNQSGFSADGGSPNSVERNIALGAFVHGGMKRVTKRTKYLRAFMKYHGSQDEFTAFSIGQGDNLRVKSDPHNHRTGSCSMIARGELWIEDPSPKADMSLPVYRRAAWGNSYLGDPDVEDQSGEKVGSRIGAVDCRGLGRDERLGLEAHSCRRVCKSTFAGKTMACCKAVECAMHLSGCSLDVSAGSARRERGGGRQRHPDPRGDRLQVVVRLHPPMWGPEGDGRQKAGGGLGEPPPDVPHRSQGPLEERAWRH